MPDAMQILAWAFSVFFGGLLIWAVRRFVVVSSDNDKELREKHLQLSREMHDENKKLSDSFKEHNDKLNSALEEFIEAVIELKSTIKFQQQGCQERHKEIDKTINVNVIRLNKHRDEIKELNQITARHDAEISNLKNTKS
jgi:hypothetical protein